MATRLMFKKAIASSDFSKKKTMKVMRMYAMSRDIQSTSKLIMWGILNSVQRNLVMDCIYVNVIKIGGLDSGHLNLNNITEMNLYLLDFTTIDRTYYLASDFCKLSKTDSFKDRLVHGQWFYECCHISYF